jgi:hypothetical protein
MNYAASGTQPNSGQVLRYKGLSFLVMCSIGALPVSFDTSTAKSLSVVCLRPLTREEINMAERPVFFLISDCLIIKEV